jgi:hypothetical protein
LIECGGMPVRQCRRGHIEQLVLASGGARVLVEIEEPREHPAQVAVEGDGIG